MKIRVVLSVISLVVVLGCSPKVSVPEDEPSGDGLPKSTDVTTESVVEFGIGDVETGIQLVVTINESLVSDQVEYEELETKKYEIAIVRAKVSKPYPDTLPIVVKFRRWIVFSEHAVQVKPHLFIDDEEVLEMDGLMYGGEERSSHRELTLNLFDYMEEVPETILVRVEADFNLFLGAGDEGVTLDTPLASDTQSVIKVSNPLRIDFAQ